MMMDILEKAIKNELDPFKDRLKKFDEVLQKNKQRLKDLKDAGEISEYKTKKMIIKSVAEGRTALRGITESFFGDKIPITSIKDLKSAINFNIGSLEQKIYDNLGLDKIMDDPSQMMNYKPPEILSDSEKEKWLGIQSDLHGLGDSGKGHVYDHYDLRKRVDLLKESIMLVHISNMKEIVSLHDDLPAKYQAINESYDAIERIAKSSKLKPKLKDLKESLVQANVKAKGYRKTILDGFSKLIKLKFVGNIFAKKPNRSIEARIDHSIDKMIQEVGLKADKEQLKSLEKDTGAEIGGPSKKTTDNSDNDLEELDKMFKLDM